jgi:hypothetical protein
MTKPIIWTSWELSETGNTVCMVWIKDNQLAERRCLGIYANLASALAVHPEAK